MCDREATDNQNQFLIAIGHILFIWLPTIKLGNNINIRILLFAFKKVRLKSKDNIYLNNYFIKGNIILRK